METFKIYNDDIGELKEFVPGKGKEDGEKTTNETTETIESTTDTITEAKKLLYTEYEEKKATILKKYADTLSIEWESFLGSINSEIDTILENENPTEKQIEKLREFILILKIKEGEQKKGNEAHQSSYELRTKILQASRGKMMTCEAYTHDPRMSHFCFLLPSSGLLNPALKPEAKIVLEEEDGWVEERKTEHGRIVDTCIASIKGLSDAVIKEEKNTPENPAVLYNLYRGNIAAGKTTKVTENKAVQAYMNGRGSIQDIEMGIIAPDAFKGALLDLDNPPILSTQQTHEESLLLDRKAKRIIQEYVNNGTWKNVRFFVDRTLAEKGEVLEYVEGGKVNIIDLDVDFHDSILGLLGRPLDTNEPRSGFIPVSRTATVIREERIKILECVLDNSEIQSYTLHRRIENGSKNLARLTIDDDGKRVIEIASEDFPEFLKTLGFPNEEIELLKNTISKNSTFEEILGEIKKIVELNEWSILKEEDISEFMKGFSRLYSQDQKIQEINIAWQKLNGQIERGPDETKLGLYTSIIKNLNGIEISEPQKTLIISRCSELMELGGYTVISEQFKEDFEKFIRTKYPQDIPVGLTKVVGLLKEATQNKNTTLSEFCVIHSTLLKEKY